MEKVDCQVQKNVLEQETIRIDVTYPNPNRNPRTHIKIIKLFTILNKRESEMVFEILHD